MADMLLMGKREWGKNNFFFLPTEREGKVVPVFQLKTDVAPSRVIREMDNSLTSVQTTIKRDLVLPQGR